MPAAINKAKNIIKKWGGIIRTAEAIKAGIHPRTLYALRDRGMVEQLSRGVYRLTELPSIVHPDIVTASLRVQRSVVCLLSALIFHEITTQVQHEVTIAIPKGARTPHIDYPPLTIYHFSPNAFVAGVEQHELDGVLVNIYSHEKTIADCFKFRNAIGMDVVIEALKRYKQRHKPNPDKILKYAEICRVKKIMLPYLEAIM